jgi:hypothetical protein
MGGCFPCFGSSNKEDTNAVKEVSKKDTFKEASLPQSHHPTRVSSGLILNFEYFYIFFIMPSLFDYCVLFNSVQFYVFICFYDLIFMPMLFVDLIWFVWSGGYVDLKLMVVVIGFGFT